MKSTTLNALTFIILASIISAPAYGRDKKGKRTSIEHQNEQNKVVAEATSVKVSVDDVIFAFESLNEDLKKLAQTLDGRKELIDTILMRELMYQQAQKEGVDKLKSVKLKINDLEKKVIVEAYLKKNINAKPLLSDVILKEYYNKNLDKYVTEEQFRISHIIVATETAAKEVLSKLNDNQSFKNLATRYSIDRAAYKGGDLGWFSEGNFIPEFEETALELDVGEISDIVKTKFGYHIIKLTGKRPAGQRSFAEVKRLIHDELKPIKEQELFDKMKKDLRKANNFKYRDNIIDNIDFYSNNTND